MTTIAPPSVAQRRVRNATLALAAPLLMGSMLLAAQSAAVQDPPVHHHHEGMAMPMAVDVPGDSLYQLSVSLQTSEGGSLTLASLRGRPLLVTMFYSQCTSVCPLLTSHMQRLIASLSPAERQALHVLMVSFDSVRDTPEVLHDFRVQRHIDTGGWTVAHASAQDIRLLAASLGIRYRELPDHTFNHTALIALADRDGTVRAQSVGVTAPDDAFMRTLHAQLVTARANRTSSGSP